MGSALMFKKWAVIRRSIAGAAALCGVFFLSCIGNKDVEPLRVREMLEIPLNFEMNLNNLASDRVFDVVYKGIADAVSEDPLEPDDLNALTSEMMGDEGIIDYVTTGNVKGGGSIYDYVINLMHSNETVQNILTERGRLGDIEEIAEKVAKELETFREERNTRLENITESTSPEIPAPGDSLKLIDNPNISYRCVLDNKRCPFNFTIYALFFKEEWKPLIDGMEPDDFIDFMAEPDNYKDSVGMVNLFYDGTDAGLEVEAEETPKTPPKSDDMEKLLLDWFKGGNAPLGTRWVVRCKDPPDVILDYMNKEGEYFIDVNLSVKVEFTLDLGTLFDL
jgi:hypothetical protein